MNYTLKDILDIPKLKELLNSLEEIRSLPSGIRDLEGNILIASGWQDICTKFHRRNPETENKCIESDLRIETELFKSKTYISCNCPMGLIDAAIPIIVEGKHLGNIYVGQFLMAPPDEKHFSKQARHYGFDENEYLEALKKVPIFSEEQFHPQLVFIAQLAQMLAEQGLQSLRQREVSDALQKSEELSRRIIASSSDCIKVLNIDGHLLSMSESGQKLLDIDDLSLYLGLSWIDFWKEDKEKAQEAVFKAVNGDICTFYGYCETAKGTPKWWEVIVTPIMGEDNKIENLLAVSRDITKRKLAEEGLRKSEAELSEAQRVAHIGSFCWDAVADAVWWSDELYRIYEKPLNSPPSNFENDQKNYTPESAAQLTVVVHKALQTGEPYIIDLEQAPIDGKRRWVQARAEVKCDEKGEIIGLHGTVQDISERKQAEEALKKSEYFFKESQRAALIGSYYADFTVGKWESSEVLDTIFGINDNYDRSIQGWLDIVYPDDRERMDRYLMEEVISKRKPFSYEYRIIRKNDGEIRWVDGRGSVKFDNNANVLIMMGTIQDITERKQVEDTLRKSENDFRMLANSMPQIVWVCSSRGENIYFNQRWVDYTGLTLKESHDQGWNKPFHPDDQQKAWDAWQNAILKGADYVVECRLRRVDGIYKWWLIRGVPVHDESGAVQKWFGTCTDIDDIKKAEEEKKAFEQQMQHTQKLESLGVLAGGIAHDFNNILAIIMGYCSLTKMDYEDAEKHIPEIEKAAERAAGLCRQMLSYAGKAQLALSQVNFGELVGEMVNMLKTTIPKNSVIKPDLSPAIPLIKGDASQLRQVVMNLIINASEAIGQKQGEIQVSLVNTSVISGQSEVDYHGKPIPLGEYICLEVTDNGCGMDEETKWRIFEPFYTTKFSGRGLGMSAVLGIISSHNGALQLFSQLGQGSIFKVYLPIPDNGATGDRMPQQITSLPWQGSGTILLVEDEDQIRLICKAFLKRFGFAVVEAANGKEALEIYQKNAAEIMLVLTDIGMPVMDGYEMFRELKKLCPELPVIITSGFGDADIISGIDREDIAGIINKPYNPDQLREVLKSVVEGKRRSQ